MTAKTIAVTCPGCNAVREVGAAGHRQHLERRGGFVLCRACSKRGDRSPVRKLVGSVGSEDHPHYRRWGSMKNRCLNPNHHAFHRYGGRGITVCDEWLDFEGFAAWVETSGYQPGLTLDRKDNDGPYSPGNCQWSTPKEQAANRHDAWRSTRDDVLSQAGTYD